MPVLGRARLGNRLNAFRLGHFDVSCNITVGGTVRSNTILKASLTIADVRGSAPNTATFTTKINPGWTPTRGQAVVIGLGSISNVIFGGQIEAVEQTYADKGLLSQLVWKVSCTDYTRLLNRRKVWAIYDGTEAHLAVQSLLTTYTSGFSDFTKIANGLGLVSGLEFAGADVTDVLDQLATAVSARWYVDYSRRVHFEVTSTDLTPTAITSTHASAKQWAYRRLLRQARTRIYVHGAASKIAAPVAIGQTILPVEDIARFVGGSAAVTGAQVLTYTGTSVTTDDTAALVAGTPVSIAAPTLALARSASTVSVSGITRSGQVATVTTSGAHGFAVGLTVKIAGADQNDYNGSYAIETVPLTTTFTVTVPGSPTSPATGTITAQKVMGGPIVGVVSHKISAVVARTSGSSTRNFETNVGTASSPITGETLAAPAALAAGEAHSASTVAITSITRSGSVATVTTTGSHGYAAGMQVTIAGTGEAAYNGTFTIATVTSATVFTYPISGSPGSPAGGTKTAQAVTAGVLIGAYRYRYTDVSARGETLASAEATATATEVAAPAAATAAEAHSASTVSVSSITRSGTIATVTTSGAHGYAVGMSIEILGAVQTPYNGTFTVVSVTAATVFTYRVTGSPATPATGTITAQARTAGPLIGAYNYTIANVTRSGETLQSAAASVTATEIAEPGAASAAQSSTVDAGLPPGNYAYYTTFVSAAGETALGTGVNGAASQVTAPGAGTATASTTVDGGLPAGTYAYKVTYGTSRGETTLGTGFNATTSVVTAPGAASGSETTGGSLTLLGVYKYKVTYYTSRGETTLGSELSVTLTGSNNAVSLSSIPTSGDSRVVGRKIYRTKAGGSVFFLIGTIGDNSATTWTDGAADTGLSTLAPTANSTGGQIGLTNLPTSADGRVVNRRVYRTRVGGSDYYLLTTIPDNSTTTFTDTTLDTSLSTLGPTANSTGSQIDLSSIPTSSDARVISRRIYRTKSGGIVNYLLTTLNDNTTTTYSDSAADSSLTQTGPSEAQNNGAAIKLTSIPIPTDPRVVGRRIYRTEAGGTVYKFLATIGDITTASYTDTTPDADLGVSAPTEGSGHGGAIKLTSIAVSSDPRVVARRLYRTVAGGTEFRLLATIGDNVAISYTDSATDSELGGTMPATNTFGGDSILVTAIPLGPTGTIARKVYRTLAGGSVYKYAGSIPDNTSLTYTDSKADADLGEEAPAASKLGPVAGDLVLRVSDLAKFNANGGWTIVSGIPIRYTARAASSGEGNLTGIPASGVGAIVEALTVDDNVVNKGYLTGVAGVTKAIEQGNAIRLRVTREDTAAQTALAALEGGDGIHEHAIDAGDLAVVGECNIAGDKELADFDAGEDTFEWTTRDQLTKSGVPITVTIGSPHNISVTFDAVQDVTWTQFETFTYKVDGVDIFSFPQGRATAGRTRLTLVDLLRMVEASK